MKSAGKNFGMEIVWYVALLGQAAPVQAADEEEFVVVPIHCGCEVDRSLVG